MRRLSDIFPNTLIRLEMESASNVSNVLNPTARMLRKDDKLSWLGRVKRAGERRYDAEVLGGVEGEGEELHVHLKKVAHWQPCQQPIDVSGCLLATHHQSITSSIS